MRSYELEPLYGFGPTLVFEWDQETGELRGRDEARVRALVERALRDHVAMGKPYPTPFEMTDPLRKPSELAVLLGNAWRLPLDLRRAYPKPPTEDDLADDPAP